MKTAYKTWLIIISLILFVVAEIFIMNDNFLGAILLAISIIGVGWFVYLKVSESKEPLKNKTAWIISAIAFVVVITTMCFKMPSVYKWFQGDDIDTCKNCGKDEVVLFGYCEDCADSFLGWQNKLD